MRLPLVFAAIFFFGLPAAAQQATVPGEKEKQTEVEQERHRKILARVESYADRLASFDDAPSKIDAMGEIAEALCRCDQVAGRDLFARSHAILMGAEAATASGPSGRNYSSQAGMLDVARGNLLVRLRRCDLSLWKVLANRNGPAALQDSLQNAGALMSKASDAVRGDDPTKAAAFIEEALKHHGQALWTGTDEAAGAKTANGEITRLASLLVEMHRKAPDAADALFLKGVSSLRDQPAVDARNLLALGLYPFTPTPIGDTAFLTRTVTVEGITLVSLSANRLGVATQGARAYLEAAVDVLSRLVADPEQKKLYYAAARVLLPKVREFLPDRVPVLEGVTQALGGDTPALLKDPQVYQTLDDSHPDSGGMAREKGIESLSEGPERDQAYLQFVLDLAQRRRFERAREILKKAGPSELKTKIEELLDFLEAAELIERNQLEAAEQVSARLPAGAARAMLTLGLAAARWKTDKETAASEVFAALHDARDLDDDLRAPLLVAAAGVLARFRPSPALVLLGQAVRASNQSDAALKAQEASARREERPRPRGFLGATLWIGNSAPTFAYVVRGAPWDNWAPVVSTLTAFNAQATERIVLDLQNEHLLAQALPSLAAALLKDLPPRAPEKGEPEKP